MANRTAQFHRSLGAMVLLAMLVAGLLGIAHPAEAAGSISLPTVGAPYAQNFDTLASSGTSSTPPPTVAPTDPTPRTVKVESRLVTFGNAVSSWE